MTATFTIQAPTPGPRTSAAASSSRGAGRDRRRPAAAARCSAPSPRGQALLLAWSRLSASPSSRLGRPAAGATAAGQPCRALGAGPPRRADRGRQLPRPARAPGRGDRPPPAPLAGVRRWSCSISTASRQVNERFGHLEGDRLLAEIGAALSDEVRAEDSVFRQGGDEFAVIVPETNAEEAEEVAARLRATAARGGSDGPARSRPRPASRCSRPTAPRPRSCSASPTSTCSARSGAAAPSRGGRNNPGSQLFSGRGQSRAQALTAAVGASFWRRKPAMRERQSKGGAMRRVTAAALVAIAVAVLGMAEGAGASPGSPATAIVSLGDSFISGEGGRWMGNGSEPFGTRSGTDRAAFDCGWLGLPYDPAGSTAPPRGTTATAPTWRRSSARRWRSARRSTSPARGRRRRTCGRAASGGQPHFGEAPQADQLAALAGATTCGWWWSPSAPTTSASAGWWRAAPWTGRAARLTTRSSATAARRRISMPPCRRGRGACARRCARCGRRWRTPATGARTTAW